MKIVLSLIVAAAVLPCAAPASAAPAYGIEQVGTFDEALYATGAPGSDRLFVVERAGRIRVVRHGKVLKRPFLDISDRVFRKPEEADHRGLIGLALAPHYPRSGRMYLLYVNRDDNVQVDEVRRSATNANRADPASRRDVLTIGKARIYHHGGQLAFGPDGMLYVSTGISDDPSLSQNLGDLHGKLLRIDPRRRGAEPYTVPADNPFVGRPGARPEVWAYGLRNPWRFSFDRLTGNLILGDVGEDTVEEVDFLAHDSGGGANFGFPIFEGDQRLNDTPAPPDYVPPIFTARHPGFCAVMGGYVVRDKRLRGLYGRYLFADMCSSRVYSARVGAGGARRVKPLPVGIPTPVSFGEDGRGRIYLVNRTQGVFRLVPVTGP